MFQTISQTIMRKNEEQRVAVMVDVQNMYHSAKNLYNSRVNFKEVLKASVGSRRLVRANAYAIKSQSVEETSFFDVLAKQGFDVRLKDLQVFAGGAKKGDWDIGIAIDAIKIADKVDVIILVTGDGDFRPLLRFLQENKGCRVEVVAFSKSCSSKLIEEAEGFIDLSEDQKRFLIKINDNH
jgi:uncharacterized protein (TIGR00288 family)